MTDINKAINYRKYLENKLKRLANFDASSPRISTEKLEAAIKFLEGSKEQ